MVKIGILTVIWMTWLTGISSSAGVMVPGDFYLISRDTGGIFSGSHQIFQRKSAGMRQVSYCGRDYWIRPVTVAWTQIEVENSRQVQIEFNFGKGWRPICDKPEQQVTLKDIGITQDARVVLYTNGRDLGGVSRFTAISGSFKTGNTYKKTTFHD